MSDKEWKRVWQEIWDEVYAARITNSDRLREIAERAEKATPGPWEAHVAIRYPGGTAQERGVLGPNGENPICWVVDEFEMSTSNDDFIAAAREDVPFLLSEITKLNAEKAETIEVLEEFPGRDWYDSIDTTEALPYYSPQGQWYVLKGKPLLDKLKGES